MAEPYTDKDDKLLKPVAGVHSPEMVLPHVRGLRRGVCEKGVPVPDIAALPDVCGGLRAIRAGSGEVSWSCRSRSAAYGAATAARARSSALTGLQVRERVMRAQELLA